MNEEMVKEITDMCDGMELDILEIKHRLSLSENNEFWIKRICDGIKHTATALQAALDSEGDEK